MRSFQFPVVAGEISVEIFGGFFGLGNFPTWPGEEFVSKENFARKNFQRQNFQTSTDVRLVPRKKKFTHESLKQNILLCFQLFEVQAMSFFF